MHGSVGVTETALAGACVSDKAAARQEMSCHTGLLLGLCVLPGRVVGIWWEGESLSYWCRRGRTIYF